MKTELDQLIQERNELRAAPMTAKERVMQEQTELAQKIGKLEEFKKTDKFNALSLTMRSLLITQANIMRDYLCILSQRLIRWEGE